MKSRIKVLRAENDWSQARLAAELGVSRQTVNAIETGKYDPSLPLAFDIARVFGKPIEDIFFADAEAVRREKKPAVTVATSQLPFPDLDVSLL